MKKITIFLAAILCAFGLTACGTEKYSQFQQEKIDTAIDVASTSILPYLSVFMDTESDRLDYPWDEYTMEEVKTQGESVYQMAVSYGILQTKYSRIEVDGYGFYNALTSFSAAGKEIGVIQSTDLATAKVDDEQIIVTIPVYCEKGDATVEIIFSNDQFLVLKSASITQNFTLGQKMSKAGLNTLIGIGTVFVVLILICLLISLFGFIPKIQKSIADSKAKKAAAKNAATAGIDNAVNQIIANETAAEDESDDLELVAVIAAAIAAYEGSGSADGYVVRSIRRRR